MEGGQAVSLEEQLRKDAESMREVGWFNRAKMYTAAADEIHRLEDRIKRLEEALDTLVKMHRSFIGKDDGITHERSYYCFYKGQYDHWKKAIDVLEAKEAKP
jgi:hypothetical protein